MGFREKLKKKNYNWKEKRKVVSKEINIGTKEKPVIRRVRTWKTRKERGIRK